MNVFTISIANIIKQVLLNNNFQYKIFINGYPQEKVNNCILISDEQAIYNNILNQVENHFQIYINAINDAIADKILKEVLKYIKNSYDFDILFNNNNYIFAGIILKNINYLGKDEKGNYEITINYKILFNIDNP